MLHRATWRAVTPLAALLLLSCKQAESAPVHINPANVEHTDGSDLGVLTLTEKAAERLGVETAPLAGAFIDEQGRERTAVPYSAVLYDANGETWVYTNPAPLTFVRHRIEIESIEGDLAIITSGPEQGTQVVTVAASELFGTEFEVGH